MSDSKDQSESRSETFRHSVLFVLTSSATIVWTVLFYLFARDEYEYNYVGGTVLFINGALLLCAFLSARWLLHLLTTEKPVEWFGWMIAVIGGLAYVTLPFQGIPAICLNIDQKGGAFYTPTPLTMLMILHTLGWGLLLGGCILFFLGILICNFVACLCCPERNQIKL